PDPPLLYGHIQTYAGYILIERCINTTSLSLVIFVFTFCHRTFATCNFRSLCLLKDILKPAMYQRAKQTQQFVESLPLIIVPILLFRIRFNFLFLILFIRRLLVRFIHLSIRSLLTLMSYSSAT